MVFDKFVWPLINFSSFINAWLFQQEVFLGKGTVILADINIMSQIDNNVGRLLTDQNHSGNHLRFDKLVGPSKPCTKYVVATNPVIARYIHGMY